MHIYIEAIMFTIKLFDSLVSSKRNKIEDQDLHTWARIEFRKDPEFAYNYIKEYGVAPSPKVMS